MQTFTNTRMLLPGGPAQGMRLQTQNGKIAAIEADAGSPRGESIDLQGCYLAPGFIDIHCHGGGGHDFMDNTTRAMEGALRTHMHHGTTTLLPTTVSCSVEELRALGETLRSFLASPAAKRLPFVPGLHMEGPYIAAGMCGAQDTAYITSPAALPPQQVLAALGTPPLVWTVAPELPGALELCRSLRGQGVLFSAGHSDAVYADVLAARKAGFTMATHLYSSMSTIRRKAGYRLAGLLESALLLDELAVEVIADGVHVPPELLRLTVKTKGEAGIILVTDAMRAAGMPPGVYKLGSLAQGQDVLVDEEIARMPDGDSFAGSIATADKLVRVMVRQAGVPLPAAVKMLTENPARAVGLAGRKGALAPGMDADLVVFDEDIRIKMVVIGGEICYKNLHS